MCDGELNQAFFFTSSVARKYVRSTFPPDQPCLTASKPFLSELEKKARRTPKDSWQERLQEARTPEARNSLQWRKESTMFVDVFSIYAHTLFKQIVKNFNYFCY